MCVLSVVAGGLTRKLSSALNVGVDHARATTENNYARRTNLMGLVLFATSLPYGPLLAHWGFPLLGSIVLFNTLLYLSPFPLHRLGLFTFAKLAPPLIATANIAAIALWFGPGAQVHLALFIFLSLPFQVFDVRRDLLALSFPVLTCSGLFLAVQLDTLPDSMSIALDPKMEANLRAAFGVGTMLVFALTLGYFYANNQANEDALATSVETQEATILELKNTQASLKQARDEATRAAQAKGEFLSMVSHELNTPLHGIMGSLEALRQIVKGDDGQFALELLSKSSARLSYLLSGLVDFVQIGRDDQYVRRAPFDLVGVLRECDNDYHAAAAEKGLTWSVHVDAYIENLALGDVRRVRQLLEAVIGNAIRYTKEGSVRLEATLRETNGCVDAEVCVIDTGPGIAPELKEKVFEEFVQTIDQKHRGADGLGLGLAISRRILSSMDGSIVLEDDESGGTRATLRFALPLTSAGRESAQSQREAVTSKVQRTTPRVLIAEDNPVSLKLLTRSLARLGFEVTGVENGQFAVDQWREQEFDLLLLDVQMPEMDGLGAARIIRSEESEGSEGASGSRSTPIVFLTANTSAEQEAEAWEIGIEGYLNKPCPPTKLRQALADIGLIGATTES